jgi:hypothetical protein
LSFQVLVIPEDPTYNGYILTPLVSRILAECGKAKAKVKMLDNPKVSGIAHVFSLLPDIVERYAHFDLLLLLVDADGRDRSGQFERFEAAAAARLARPVRLICCAAVQEVEAWLLAGHTARLGRPWSEVRADVSVKENIFEGFLSQFGDPRTPGGGRDALMKETLSNYRGLLKLCPEVAELQEKVCDGLP